MTAADRAMLDRPLLTSRSRRVLLAAALVGLAAFVVGAVTNATRAWSVLLVNFLFWSGLGHAGVAFSAIFQITSADRKSTRLNSSHIQKSRMPSSA